MDFSCICVWLLFFFIRWSSCNSCFSLFADESAPEKEAKRNNRFWFYFSINILTEITALFSHFYAYSTGLIVFIVGIKKKCYNNHTSTRQYAEQIISVCELIQSIKPAKPKSHMHFFFSRRLHSTHINKWKTNQFFPLHS